MGAQRDTGEIIFGTDGWRGIIADDFTFANVRKVTRAIALYLSTTYNQSQPVLVAYDTRFLADRFAKEAAEVLASLGWTVKVAERDCPTPAIAYSAKNLNSAGALMFTASHNPASYCGIKYIPDYAGPATSAITDAIEANLSNTSDRLPDYISHHKILPFDPKPDYLRFIYNLLDCDRIRSARLKVKYDALYSTSRGYLDTVLEYCGCDTQSLHTYRDVLFGGGMPDPKGEQLQNLIAEVKADRADLGLATDGDGDRFGIVDERGNALEPNTVLMILAKHLVQNKGKRGAIVRTVATTQLLDKLALKYGLEIYETPVGFKYIGEMMRKTQVLIGGEESGGLSITGHIPEKDGILANMLVVEAIAYERKPLSQIVAEVIQEVGGPLLNYRLDLHLSNPHKAAVMDAFANKTPTAIASIPVKSVGYTDGVKLYLENGAWILLRPSGTEPLVRVYMETASVDQQTAIVRDMQSRIQALEPVSC